MPTRQKATRQDTKEHNRRLILKVIYDEKAISRADIARITQLTRPAVSAAVAQLIEDGFVSEIGQVSHGRGKPATMLQIEEDAQHVIGLDLSNRNFQGAIFNLRGKPVLRIEKSIQGYSEEKILDALYQLLDELFAATERPIMGVGIGTPGLLDIKRGVVRVAVNLGWHNFPLQEKVAERYQCPVYIYNDSQAAALAQFTFDTKNNGRDLILVKAGRGISAGIILDGGLYNGGNQFGASEIGHMRVSDGGELCACGHFGCLETVASSRVLVRQAWTLAENNPDSSLHQLVGDLSEITTDVVVQAIEIGDPQIEEIVTRIGRHLGVVCASLVSVLNIPRIIIAGSLARLGSTLIEGLREEMRQRALVNLIEESEVELSSLGQDIVLLGAASLVHHHELGIV